MQAQFDHLSETYFGGYEFDLGEREHGMALSCDHDLEMFAAAVGYVKTSVAAILKDEGKTTTYYARCSIVSLCLHRCRARSRGARAGDRVLRTIAEAAEPIEECSCSVQVNQKTVFAYNSC